MTHDGKQQSFFSSILAEKKTCLCAGISAHGEFLHLSFRMLGKLILVFETPFFLLLSFIQMKTSPPPCHKKQDLMLILLQKLHWLPIAVIPQSSVVPFSAQSSPVSMCRCHSPSLPLEGVHFLVCCQQLDHDLLFL